jgi:putative flippase GtrA
VIGSITRLWRDQRVRFLVVGAFNTAISIPVSWSIFFFLAKLLHLDQRLIAEITTVIATILNITIAFVGYKFVVFRTRGNYLPEYLRFYIVYAIPTICGLVLLPVLMTVLQHRFGNYTFYIAQGFLTAVTIIISYVGHKRITFRQTNVPDPTGPPHGFPIEPLPPESTSTPAKAPSRYPTSR